MTEHEESFKNTDQHDSRTIVIKMGLCMCVFNHRPSVQVFANPKVAHSKLTFHIDTSPRHVKDKQQPWNSLVLDKCHKSDLDSFS